MAGNSHSERPVRRVSSALFFFPRGGSSRVARELCLALPSAGWQAVLTVGSLGPSGAATDALTFFDGVEVVPVEYKLPGPTSGPGRIPFQPSYEDRPGAPDEVFAKVGDEKYERLVEAWQRALEAAGAGSADVLHLHHLTPMNEAAMRSFPHVPMVGQLHGTELAMMRAIAADPPPDWTYAQAWAGRLRRWAQACSRLMVPPGSETEVHSLLGVSPARMVVVPSGVELERFHPQPQSVEERLSYWQRTLVDEPRGWDESGLPGSVAYRPEDLRPFEHAQAVFLFVGRYTAVKRIPLLVRAHKHALEVLQAPAPLVLVGGHPGEWEEEHPLASIREARNDQVFLAGWHTHDELPAALNAADVLVLPSVAEAFGLVLVEAMACGLPVIAVDAHGPATIVAPGTGWLVPPDDEAALTTALIEAAADEAERRRRGRLALDHVRRTYAWQGVARQMAVVFEEAISAVPERRHAGPTSSAR